jgi:hypothetical protein
MLMIGALVGLLPSTAPALAHASGTAAAAKFRWYGECNVQCSNGRCVPVCRTDTVFAVDALDAKLKAEAQFRAQASTQGTIIEGTVRVSVVLDLFESHDRAGRSGLGSLDRRIILAAATAPAQAGFPGHFRYRLEAYRHGQLVASTFYETDAENPLQLASLMLAAQAAWSQQLRSRGIDWDRIVNVGPL